MRKEEKKRQSVSGTTRVMGDGFVVGSVKALPLEEASSAGNRRLVAVGLREAVMYAASRSS